MPNAYIADAPVKDPTEDLFRRWPFAQRVAQTLAARQDPSSIVVSIYGAWGEGKTTVLNFIHAELKSHPNVLSLRFNPWRFPNETALLKGFFGELVELLSQSSSGRARLAGSPKASARSSAGEKDAGFGGGPLSSLELEEFRRRVEGALSEEGRRVVVLMDDIDRLDKTEIQAVFRLIKLTADFDRIAYIVAFDDEAVASALQEKYSGKDANAGRNFLEKIVQVPLTLPSVPISSLRDFCFQSVHQAVNQAGIQLSEEDNRTFVKYFIDGLEIRLKTPRMAKRYGNALAFALPILKDAVNVVDLMLIEGVRVFYPAVYAVVKKHSDLFTGESFAGTLPSEKQKEGYRQVVESALIGLDSEERDAAVALLSTLFPRLKSIYGKTVYDKNWENGWREERRIASPSYFHTYFSYAVAAGDSSGSDLNSFLLALPSATKDQLSWKLRTLVDPQSADKIVAELRSKAKYLSSQESMALASAISQNGSIFPVKRSLFSFQEAFSQAAMLVSDLLENVADTAERFSDATTLLREAEPVTFAVEIHQWLRASQKDDPKALSYEQKAALGKTIAGRIKQLALESDSFVVQYSADLPSLLAVWSIWGSFAETNRYLQNLLEGKPTLAVCVVESYLPSQRAVDSIPPSRGDFDRDQYDSLRKVVYPEIVYASLLTVYGNRLITPEYPRGDGPPTDERIAQQFTWVHKHVRGRDQERNQTQNATPG